MKSKIILGIVVLLSTAFTSCKNESPLESETIASPKTTQSDFQVTIEVLALKDDHFALYYTTDGSINFFNIPPVFQSFKGSSKPQKINFIVPGHQIPTQFRIDFGMNQNQSNVILKAVTMKYAGNIYTIPGVHIFDYFEVDGNTCTVDPSAGILTAKIIKGKRQTPSIYPNPKLLGRKIKALTQ